MNENIKLLLSYMQQYIDEPNAPDCSGEYPVCWEITTDECECILNYIKSLQQENKQLKEEKNKLEQAFIELYKENQKLFNHLTIDKILKGGDK